MNNGLLSALNIIAGPKIQLPCEICNKQSSFTCYTCQTANYCSRQHQKQHWRQGHKAQCQKRTNKDKQKILQLEKHMMEARKNYYENYSNKIFNHCLLDAKLMTGLSKQILAFQPTSVKYQLQYGASVCLLVKTYKLLNNIASAKHQMEGYLKTSKPFLYQIQRYRDMLSIKSALKDQEKQQLGMKLNLISCIANLSHIIGMSITTQFYVLYTKYVLACFGPDSFEASNCYFLMGTYFSEEGWFNKAIACFQKAAKIRGHFAGDCMFNIGVLYKLMNNLPKALHTLQISIKLRQQQYGQDSNEVAEVNQLMGSIYTQLNDYKTALTQYQKSFRIRVTNTLSPQYENILDLIHQLYDKLCLYIKLGQPNMKRPEIYVHLRQQIEGQPAYWQNEKYQKKRKQDQQNMLSTGMIMDKQQKDKDKYKKKKQAPTQQEKKAGFSWKQSGLFNITQEFVSNLNLSELYRLSELQLQLQTCESVFNLAYIVGTSQFFEAMRPQMRQQLGKINEKLFEMMKMEDIKKMKHKDK